MLLVGTVLKVAGQHITHQMKRGTTWVVTNNSGRDWQLERLTKKGKALAAHGEVETMTLPLLAHLIGQGRVAVKRKLLPISADAAPLATAE